MVGEYKSLVEQDKTKIITDTINFFEKEKNVSVKFKDMKKKKDIIQDLHTAFRTGIINNTPESEIKPVINDFVKGNLLIYWDPRTVKEKNSHEHVNDIHYKLSNALVEELTSLYSNIIESKPVKKITHKSTSTVQRPDEQAKGQ